MHLLEDSNEVIVGTNEEYILGYKIINEENDNVSLELSFANHAHNGRVKDVAVSKQFLVSGGTDEFIRIFNMNTRKEIGSMIPHNGSISCLEFHESGFLFSAAEDGRINIYKRGQWEVQKELIVGNHGVNGFSVHPSGKLALSVSKDRKITTWDMTKGKRVYIASLKTAGEVIRWSPNGSHYVIVSLNILDVYDVKTADVVNSIDFGEHIYCLCFLTDDVLVVGGEKNSLSIFSLTQQKELLSWEAHENRVKCITQLNTTTTTTKSIVTGSSDGFIRIWSIDIENFDSPPKLLGETDTNCRVICMTVYSNIVNASHTEKSSQNTSVKSKKKQNKKKVNNELSEKANNATKGGNKVVTKKQKVEFSTNSLSTKSTIPSKKLNRKNTSNPKFPKNKKSESTNNTNLRKVKKKPMKVKKKS